MRYRYDHRRDILQLSDRDRIPAMPGVRKTDEDDPNEIRLPLRAPLTGNEASDMLKAIPELQKYLKAHYPEVQEVKFAYRNPLPEDAQHLVTLNSFLIHEG